LSDASQPPGRWTGGDDRQLGAAGRDARLAAAVRLQRRNVDVAARSALGRG